MPRQVRGKKTKKKTQPHLTLNKKERNVVRCALT